MVWLMWKREQRMKLERARSQPNPQGYQVYAGETPEGFAPEVWLEPAISTVTI